MCVCVREGGYVCVCVRGRGCEKVSVCVYGRMGGGK